MRNKKAAFSGSPKTEQGNFTTPHLSRQQAAIIGFVKENGSITHRDASNKLGIFGFHGRLKELREKGYQFSEVIEKGITRYGSRAIYYRYFLIHEPRYQIEVEQ